MSPEQARGDNVDKGADIWAFGVVLFEMLTGSQVFTGKTVSDTLASVLAREPEWKNLPPNLHPRIRLLLERCLEKEPKNRCSGISDARVEMQKVLTDPSGVFALPASEVAHAAHTPKRGAAIGAVAAIVLAAIAGFAAWMLKPTPPPEPKQVMRFDYHLPQNQEFSVANNLSVVGLSPDGSKFVYSTTDGLYLRSLDEMDPRFIPGTDGNSMQPFFSPDGQWIGYLSGTDQKLKKVAISGGPAVTLCDAAGDGGFSWSPDDRILHATGENIMWVSSNGGKWESLIRQEGGLLGFAQMLPDGETVMYLNAATAPSKVMVQSLKSGQQKELLEANIAQYVKTGHIVYGLENNLYAVQFDMDALEVIGGSVPLVEGVLNVTYYWHYAISDSGTLVYVTEDSPGFGQRTFVWVDREGNEQPLGAEPNSYDIYFKISPDGMKVALSIMESGNMDIWIWDQERKNSNRLTFNGSFDVRPIWTPDSKRIIFDSGREGREGIYLIEADGSGKVERVARITDRIFWPSSISADGKTLFLVENAGDEGRGNVGMLSLEGDRTPKLLLQEEYDETTPRISPDGRWIAYASDESGRSRIYVRPFPDINSGGRRQVSTSEGGDSPVWSPDGHELFYRGENSIMAVPVETEPTLKLGTPVSLFPNRYYVGEFDIHPDGNRLLMLKPAEVIDGDSTEDTTPKINVVVNWFEELKDRVPTD
jgi:serine/threonine-protein kinase